MFTQVLKNSVYPYGVGVNDLYINYMEDKSIKYYECTSEWYRILDNMDMYHVTCKVDNPPYMDHPMLLIDDSGRRTFMYQPYGIVNETIKDNIQTWCFERGLAVNIGTECAFHNKKNGTYIVEITIGDANKLYEYILSNIQNDDLSRSIDGEYYLRHEILNPLSCDCGMSSKFKVLAEKVLEDVLYGRLDIHYIKDILVYENIVLKVLDVLSSDVNLLCLMRESVLSDKIWEKLLRCRPGLVDTYVNFYGGCDLKLISDAMIVLIEDVYCDDHKHKLILDKGSIDLLEVERNWIDCDRFEFLYDDTHSTANADDEDEDDVDHGDYTGDYADYIRG